MNFPEKVQIVEVGPRDGFQNIRDFIPTERKLEIINGLINSNINKIEITSFVHPKAIPQMKDAKEIVNEVLEKYSDVYLSALVPNLYGAKAAWQTGIKEVTYVISVSEAHNKANVNRCIDESFEELEKLRIEIPELKIKLDLATVFGCPYLGDVPVENTLRLIEKAINLKIDEICLCDTIGIAHPIQVSEVLEKVKNQHNEVPLSLHLHDTRGMGLANILMALEKGITVFETAVGGLGGCPFAPGAAGNIATEDLVNMLMSMGIETEVDLKSLLNIAHKVKEKVHKNLTGHLVHIKKGLVC